MQGSNIPESIMKNLPEGAKIVSQEIVSETVLTEEELRKRGLTGQGFYGEQGVFTQGQPIIINQGLPGQTISEQTTISGQGFTGQTLPGQGLSGQTISGQGLTQPVTGTGLTGHGTTGSTLGKAGLVGAGVAGAGLVGAGLAGAGSHGSHGTHGTHGTHGATTTTGTKTGLTSTGMGTTALGSDYHGTFTFRPLEGKFTKDKDPIGKMDPYCKIKLGWHSGKSSVARSEGTHPTWNDVIPLEKKHHEEFAKLKVKDKDRLTLNDKIGEAKIPLAEIAAKGKVTQWFPVYKKDQMTGEILMDITFQPRSTVL